MLTSKDVRKFRDMMSEIKLLKHSLTYLRLLYFYHANCTLLQTKGNDLAREIQIFWLPQTAHKPKTYCRRYPWIHSKFYKNFDDQTGMFNFWKQTPINQNQPGLWDFINQHSAGLKKSSTIHNRKTTKNTFLVKIKFLCRYFCYLVIYQI